MKKEIVKEIVTIVLCLLAMLITYIVIGIITEKDLSAGVLIAMMITFAVTRTFLFIVFKKNEK